MQRMIMATPPERRQITRNNQRPNADRYWRQLVRLSLILFLSENESFASEERRRGSGLEQVLISTGTPE
jgi:hypothetical protein